MGTTLENAPVNEIVCNDEEAENEGSVDTNKCEEAREVENQGLFETNSEEEANIKFEEGDLVVITEDSQGRERLTARVNKLNPVYLTLYLRG